MKKNYLLLVFVLSTSVFTQLQAQTDSDAEMLAYYSVWQDGSANHIQPLKAQAGTYQIFIVGEDSTQLLRTDLAEKIESYRDEFAIVHLKVSSTTTIRILPCSEITSTRFSPINNTVVFQPDYRDTMAKRK
jgi:hypothetical protein